MIIKNTLKVFFLLTFFILSGNSFSQQLVYTPINPSFGGSPLNGNWMLSQAQAQNGFTSEESFDSRFDRDPLADFKESLNRQILGELSRNLITSMFLFCFYFVTISCQYSCVKGWHGVELGYGATSTQ